MKKMLWFIFVFLLIAIQFGILFYAYSDAKTVELWASTYESFSKQDSVSYRFIVHVSSHLMYWKLVPLFCALYACFIFFCKPTKLLLHQMLCVFILLIGVFLLIVLPYLSVFELGAII